MFIMFDSSLIENLSTQSDQYKNELLALLRDATNSICHKNHYISTISSSVAKDFVNFATEKQEKTIANAFQYIYDKFSIVNSVRDNLNYIISIGIYEKDFEIIKNDLSIDLLNAYTDYAQYIFDTHVTTDCKKIRELLLGKINHLGYSGTEGYEKLSRRMNGNTRICFLKMRCIY